MDYFLPLFLFIAFAVIVILSWQLYQSVVTKNEPLDIYLFTPQGKTRILPQGTYNWDQAYDETRILEGDEIQTLLSSRAMVRFFQKMWLRLDEETDVLLEKVTPSSSVDTYSLTMRRGKTWYHTEAYVDKSVQLNISTTHLRIQSGSGIFEVEDLTEEKGAQIVRVIKGSVQVDVVVSDGEKKREVESLRVTAGQQFVMDTSDYQAYQQYQSPEVLEPIPDAFVDEEWFLWNSRLDDALGV